MTHPIQPSPELVSQWKAELPAGVYDGYKYPQRETELCIQAAQWGADQELEACCDHIRDYQWGFVDRPDGTKMHRAVDLELARRPKPPSLKEQALEAAKRFYAQGHECCTDEEVAHDFNIICRALEALPND